MHTLDEDGNVSHYDVLFGHGLEKNVEASSLEIIEGMYHEHVVNDEKNSEIEESIDDEYIDVVQQVKKAELEADIKRWDSLKSSGKFTKEELERMVWEDFDENYQAMRNPEKDEKEDKRSAREKRMADPKKGINSPAFKEFMRQQGM